MSKQSVARPKSLLGRLSQQLDSLSPQERKAAGYLLDNPQDVGISSIREIASAADVKPNTLVRLARSVGFEGYDDFRQPFREEIRQGNLNFPDRARWLQSLAEGGELASLYSDMAASSISNIETTFAKIDYSHLKQLADVIVEAKRVFVMGVGVNHTLANNFAYLAGMALENVVALPKAGGHLVDDLARLEEGDVVIAMSSKPYRVEVIDAVKIASQRGAQIAAITDSAAAPFVSACKWVFSVDSDTPQFFPSTVATTALLETLMAFVVADASKDIVSSIERFHQQRHNLGIYFAET